MAICPVVCVSSMVFTLYAAHFNRRYGRVGHLFQGRYKGILVNMELNRYIVLNPVRAGLVDNPDDWFWSS